MSAISFANYFDSEFRKQTKGFSHNEIPLFRTLHSVLIGLNGKFKIEEYHGNSHQVTFKGNSSYARLKARCELSDLMVITYSLTTQTARLTYLQAKSERATLPSVCQKQFSANLEQWFLLSSRPAISGVGKFSPPPDLLSNALLPSIGTFVFFYKDRKGEFQTYYSIANHLVPITSYSQKNGKLQAVGPCTVVNHPSGYTECIAACDNQSFAKSLYDLQIGTPVAPSLLQTLSTRNWLAANIRSQIQNARINDRSSVLAQELLSFLEPSDVQSLSNSFGAKNMIIIKSVSENIQ